MRFPAMKLARGHKGFSDGQPKGALLHNDDSHNFADSNNGGSPLPRGSNPSPHSRGGFAAKGQESQGAGLGGSSRSSAGNPASRGGSVSARSGQPESRVPGHGGSPQHREREIPGDFHKRGGVVAHGQEFVPGSHKSDTSRMGGGSQGSGNTSGRSYNLIAGRFKRAAQGARGGGSEMKGQYGSAPVTSNT